mmetsp:Transcript_24058/g.45280  ORF Transcript_24058/g.45280 Transcript_24058/m.45280 type:complete len:236 (-) Transcript_24058:376-1083(-)
MVPPLLLLLELPVHHRRWPDRHRHVRRQVVLLPRQVHHQFRHCLLLHQGLLLLPHRNCRLRIPPHRHHQDDPRRHRLRPEEGQAERKQGRPGHPLRPSVLHVVHGEVHEVPQQERLHPDCHLRNPLLRLRQERLLPHLEEHRPHRCLHHCVRVRHHHRKDVHLCYHRWHCLHGHGLSGRGRRDRPQLPHRTRRHDHDPVLVHRLHVHEHLRHGHQYHPPVLHRRRGDVRPPDQVR